MLSSIIIFLVVLSVLILVHELGHFVVARRSGVWVEEFGIGIPPRIWGKRIGETIYSINLLPFGGFVRMHGEMTDDGVTKPKRAFINKSKKVKIVIILAGVVMNFILAALSFAIVYSFQGIPKLMDAGKVTIVGVSPESPASEVELKKEDIVVAVDGKVIKTSDEFIKAVNKREGEFVALQVLREGEEDLLSYDVVPRKEYPKDQGPIGVVISSSDVVYEFPPIYKRVAYGIYYGFRDAVLMGWAIAGGLFMILKNLIFKGIVPQDIAGPVGIYAITQEAVKFGSLAIINFLGVFSVNLAILNILPFPALDGGRLLFIFIEKLIGRKMLPKLEAAIHMTGMAILILLLVLITIRDVQRLLEAGSISGFIESFIK
jgi:regulator of sigma E protease